MKKFLSNLNVRHVYGTCSRTRFVRSRSPLVSRHKSKTKNLRPLPSPTPRLKTSLYSLFFLCFQNKNVVDCVTLYLNFVLFENQLLAFFKGFFFSLSCEESNMFIFLRLLYFLVFEFLLR